MLGVLSREGHGLILASALVSIVLNPLVFRAAVGRAAASQAHEGA